ncbi:MAG TPA: hypothetical protein VIT65_21205 [Microlunatus sp.]
MPIGYRDTEIAELRTLAPSVDQVSGGFVRAGRAVRRSRRRRTTALAALALAVVAAVALPSVVLSHLPVEVRRAGEWR